jgi:Cupin
MELLTSPHTDDLSALLERINVRSVVYCLSDLGAPWGFRVEDSAVAKFHLVLAGSARLTLGDDAATAVTLSSGELVLLAQGSSHIMQDCGDSPARPLQHILAERPRDAGRLSYGGDGPRTMLLCGGFGLGHGTPADLLGLLPPVLVLDAASNGVTRWLEPIFGLLQDEVASDAPGATAVLAKIADVFLTQTVRAYLSGLDAAIVPVRPAAAVDPRSRHVGRGGGRASSTASAAARRHTPVDLQFCAGACPRRSEGAPRTPRDHRNLRRSRAQRAVRARPPPSDNRGAPALARPDRRASSEVPIRSSRSIRGSVAPAATRPA